MCPTITYNVSSDGDAWYSDTNYKAKSNVNVEIWWESSTHTKQELQGQGEEQDKTPAISAGVEHKIIVLSHFGSLSS